MPIVKEQKSTLGFYTMGIVALFLVGFFLLVIFGAKSYRAAVFGQQQNMETRAELSYLSTILHQCDGADAISFDERVLTVHDGSSGYAFRIYLSDGKLVEDYAKADAALDPTGAQVIGTTDTFTVERRGNALCITTDAGSLVYALRSGGDA